MKIKKHCIAYIQYCGIIWNLQQLFIVYLQQVKELKGGDSKMINMVHAPEVSLQQMGWEWLGDAEANFLEPVTLNLSGRIIIKEFN